MDKRSNPIPLRNIKLTDRYWKQKQDIVRREGIQYQWEALNDRLPDAEASYCIRNFRIAAGRETGEHHGWEFQDSDVAKWLEAAAYSLVEEPDNALEEIIDSTVDLICSAQQEDGYLNTYYSINGLDNRWTNLMDNHELYCAGHMIEAAVAIYQATGKSKLMDAMCRFVSYIDSVMGKEKGKSHGYPGHPIIEMALVRLYEITKKPMHLDLANYFVSERGQEPLFFKQETERYHNNCRWDDGPLRYQYYQAGKPLADQYDAEGHAVRAMYLYSGLADVARETSDEDAIQVCERLWNSAVHRRMYVTGGIGSSEYGEAFTFDYDLPNDTVYAETCASIGLIFFAYRMLRLECRGEYADVMERALYNGAISGMALDGKSFFYVNPLEVLPEACDKDYRKHHVKAERQKWFGTACCPPNLIRLLTSLGQYIYTVSKDTLYIHLYVGSHTSVSVAGIQTDISMDTEYPKNGTVHIKVNSKESGIYSIGLRIPGWCRQYSIHINGDEADIEVRDGYAYLTREWLADDEVGVLFDMPVTVNRANPLVVEDAGKVSVSRGPVVYCLEGIDNGNNLHLLVLPENASFDAAYESEAFGGSVILYSDGVRERAEDWKSNALYASHIDIGTESCRLRWIPYYCWANRGRNEMRVWVRSFKKT